MLLLLLFAFLSGLATILAPCIWPLLPIILSSSVGGKTSTRPAGIALGVMLSFTVVTLTVSSIIRIFGIDPNILRTIAVVVIGFLGLCLIIPALSTRLEAVLSRISNRIGAKSTQGNDFYAGFVTGLALGILWAPCAGPILATITALAVTGQVTFFVVVLTISYVMGVGVPLFVLGYSGQRLLTQTKRLNAYTGRIQQAFGVIMILAALAIYTNYDKVLQVKLANTFPILGNGVVGIEHNAIVERELTSLVGSRGAPLSQPGTDSKLYNQKYLAPEFTGINKWLNTNKNLSLAELRGKVVLIDFWTYTCINCLRTLPHITQWYDTYKDKGFVVVGVHTPEFAFEKDTKNVNQAIAANKIHYPVAQDNDFTTWYAYQNQYWPAEYLIDANGYVRRTHFGEGAYEEMEEAIRGLLAESGQSVSTTVSTMPDETPRGEQSPETYLGSDRSQYHYPDRNTVAGTYKYTLSPALPVDRFTLGGTWTIQPEHITSGKDAVLRYHFQGKKVFLVIRPNAAKNGKVRILFDGNVIPAEVAGEDVKNGMITIDQDRLYTLVDLHGKTEEHTITIEFLDPGIEAFAFTFG
jgi:cytochrome c biogenesis protein CcdA/thiol-disulfide isomerase/thioredoxin